MLLLPPCGPRLRTSEICDFTPVHQEAARDKLTSGKSKFLVFSNISKTRIVRRRRRPLFSSIQSISAAIIIAIQHLIISSSCQLWQDYFFANDSRRFYWLHASVAIHLFSLVLLSYPLCYCYPGYYCHPEPMRACMCILMI